MRFVIDAQLPPGLAVRLRETGHDADHVRDIGMLAATDSEIWHHAKALCAVLITKDQDFLALSNLDGEGPAVVWIRLGNTTNRALWQKLEPVLPELIDALANGERVVEIAQ